MSLLEIVIACIKIKEIIEHKNICVTVRHFLYKTTKELKRLSLTDKLK